MVRSLAQGSTARTWTLDPNGRLRVRTDVGATTGTHTNHYDGDDDSPAWVAEIADGSHWTRNIPGVDGVLAAVQDSTSGGTVASAAIASKEQDFRHDGSGRVTWDLAHIS
jgi:hypothetical protein